MLKALYWLGGLIVLMTLAIPAPATDLSRRIILDVPERVIEKQFGVLPPSQLTAEELEAIASFRFVADTLRLLAIPVEWIDRPHTYSTATFDSMLFSHGVYPGGSVADYFEEVSYGQVAIAGDVIDWFNAGVYSPYFDFESILWSIDPLVDFSQYDGNNDGIPDAVIFLRSGTGEEDSQDPEDIWSYAIIYAPGYGPGPFDGVRISRYNTSPELFPLRNPDYPQYFTGQDTLNHIRVFCHELTHNFGLPDLYDYDAKLTQSTYNTPADSNDHPMVDWCLMGYYGYGLFSIGCDVPTHLCGWSKMQMGWVEPISLMGIHEDLVIYNIETRPDSSLYKIPINIIDGEYFLLEYRNPQSSGLFDKTDSDFSVKFWPDLTFGSDTLDRGLMITHVHDSLGAYWHRINYGLPDFPHYTVAIEDAGYNPAMDETSNPEGHVTDSAQWWYPWETRKGALFSPDVSGQAEFGPTTTPSSDGYTGPTGVIVRVDSIVSDRLYAYVENPFIDADGDGVNDAADNCLGVYNPDQQNDDTDTLGNACDNCPDVDNNDQIDSNGDGVGDACNYRWPEWDAVLTDCVQLAVGNSGNFGHNELGYTMDYTLSGDCDPSAAPYIYDGSPLVNYHDGVEQVNYYSMYSKQPFVLVTEGNWPVPTQTTADYDIYQSGTFVTPDSFLAMEKTWWAPKHPDSCAFIIQCLRLYSYDGLSHGGIAVSEAIDWDIPSDYGNNGGYDTSQHLLYLQGIEFDGMGCQPNDHRFGGMAMIAHYVNDSAIIDSATGPYSAYIVDNETYIYPYVGWDASLTDGLIQNQGYGILDAGVDLSMIMTFFYDYTVDPAETLYIYTALTSVQNDPSEKLQTEVLANIAKARLWTNDHVVTLTRAYICGDADGNESINVSDAVYIIAYIFKGGPAPDPLCVADADGNDTVNISDAVYLINYVFKGGPPPVETCCP